MADPTWQNFEDEVFQIVSTMAREGGLSVNPDRVRPRRKPRYFSAPRKAPIEFEISLEVFDEGASEPSRIWLWECKDKSESGRKVPVSDVEVLQSKLSQLGGWEIQRLIGDDERLPVRRLRLRGYLRDKPLYIAEEAGPCHSVLAH